MNNNNYSLVSKTETMWAIKEDKSPNALINNPCRSKAFDFSNDIVKYRNMTKLIIWENIDKASPVFIFMIMF